MKIHLIAIGGSVMHNLAIALKQNGHEVSGSDDSIHEPSKSRLANHGLLPDEFGWNKDRIDTSIDMIILGMHAKLDNPELKQAQMLHIPIYSFPDFIYEHSKNKQRIVIAGSHGKTTVTAMILHVLRYFNRSFDYLVGAQLDGFDTMVKLSDAPIIVIEGDEYLSSPLDSTPKFLKYHHHIGVITGIAWDHYNVYPTFEDYLKPFDTFADSSVKAGTLIYCEEDPLASVICTKEREDVTNIEYRTHPYEIVDGQPQLVTEDKLIPIKVFGQHNMQNLSCAKMVLKRIGITDEQFYEAIQTFQGAALRLEVVKEGDSTTIYRDFAHAPSKVEASTKAVKDLHQQRQIVTCLELHTFSSLNKSFIEQYQGALNESDMPIIYYNPEVSEQKNLETLSGQDIKSAFSRDDVRIFNNVDELEECLQSIEWQAKDLLFMSSGNLGGLNINQLADHIIQ